MNPVATQCEVTPKASRNTMPLPYTNTAHHKDIENCKNKTEALRVMQRFISAHGGNANAPKEYWEKLRALGVIE